MKTEQWAVSLRCLNVWLGVRCQDLRGLPTGCGHRRAMWRCTTSPSRMASAYRC
jgi:hypothetical protein